MTRYKLTVENEYGVDIVEYTTMEAAEQAALESIREGIKNGDVANWVSIEEVEV